MLWLSWVTFATERNIFLKYRSEIMKELKDYSKI